MTRSGAWPSSPRAPAPLHHLVTTHRHWDHTRALADVAEATGAVTYAGDLDAEGLPVAPTVRLVDGDRISLGDLSLDVAIVSGHTAASVVLAHRDPTGHAHVFTGDTLFPGGVGATQRPFSVLRRAVSRCHGEDLRPVRR